MKLLCCLYALGSSGQPVRADNVEEMGGARRRVRNARTRMTARRAQDDDDDDDDYDGVFTIKLKVILLFAQLSYNHGRDLCINY